MSYFGNVNTLFEPKNLPRSSSSRNIIKRDTPKQPLQVLTFAKNHRQKNRNQITEDHQIGQDIIRVLRQQNVNLKQQNGFLLQKLRMLSAKQQQAVQLSSKHQAILDDLKIQNIELKKQLQYANQLANSKVEQFGKKLAKIVKGSQQQIAQSDVSFKQLNPPDGILGLRTFHSESSKKSQKYQSKPSIQKLTSDTGKSYQELNNEFQAILYSCKVQKDNDKKRQYRKRLVQLTAKMKTFNKL